MRNDIEGEIWKQHVAILAKPGRGKTVKAKGAAARLMKQGIRVGVVDPTAAWWGMRLKADGKTPAFPMVIFGGDHGDIAITEHMGTKIGALVAQADFSWIIDISKMGIDKRTIFMTDFAEALFSNNKRRLNLFLDECHLYMPQQKLPTRASAKMTQATTNLVSGGRSLGLCVTMISQRSAKVHKDALTTAETLITLGMLAPQDINAVAGWVKVQGDMKAAKVLLESLPALKVGEGWVYAPALGVMQREKFPMIDTFDSSSAPGVGEDLRTPTELGQIDIEGIRALLSPAGRKTVPAAKSSPPGGLAGKLVSALNGRADAAALKDREAAFAAGVRQGEANITAAIPALLDTQHAASFAAGIAAGALKIADKAKIIAADPVVLVPVPDRKPLPTTVVASLLKGASCGPVIITSKTETARTAQPSPPRVDARAAAFAAGQAKEGDTSLTKPQQHLLRALAWWKAMGHDRPSRAQLAAIAGWKVGGSNLRGRLAELSSMGLIHYPDSKSVALTGDGADAAPSADTGQTLMDSIRAMLTNPQKLLFDTLTPGETHQREDVARAVGWEAGGSNLRGRLAELSALELIDYPSKGEVALQEWVQ